MNDITSGSPSPDRPPTPGGSSLTSLQSPDTSGNGKPFSGLSIAILYSDAKRENFATEKHYLTEAEVYGRAKIIAPYFEKLGATVHLLPGNTTLGSRLRELQPSLALNLIDSIRGQEYLAPSVPGTLELLDIPYTGSGILSMSINYNKFLTKKLLEQHGLPVPHYQVMAEPNEPINSLLRYPLISKINDIHGSVEIDETAISETERPLRERVKRLIATYKQEVLIEEFIAGRELSAIVFEGSKRKVYVGEKVFNEALMGGPYNIASYKAVWEDNEKDPMKMIYHYEKYEPSEWLKEDIKKAYEVLKMEDYAKFDIRVDVSGRYYFIDPNVNPAFGPEEADCAIGSIMAMYGVEFPEILKRLVSNTLNSSRADVTQAKSGIESSSAPISGPVVP